MRPTKKRLDLFSQGRRDSTEVVYDILTLAQSGVSRGKIVQQGRLNFQLATKYLSQLTSLGLIEPRSWDTSSEKYWLTRKGERVLRLLTELEDELIQNAIKVPTRNQFAGNGSQEASLSHVTSNSLVVQAEVGNENWFRSLGPVLIPLATLLAGVGLGYLIP